MAVGVDNVPEEEEDRGAASESEAVQSTSMRHRLFGRSYDSAPRHSKQGSVSASASPVVAEYKDKNGDKDEGDKEKEKDRDSLGSLRPRSKKSTDSTGKGAGERREHVFWHPCAIKDTHREALALPRLTSSSRKVSGHDRPPSTSTTGTATPKPTPKSAYKEAPVGSTSPRDPALLRKRTSSTPAPPTEARLPSPLNQGQSILEQIGDADFKGWMRKGDRYNCWKLRYLVLKGPDVYCLRSNSNAETKIKGLGYKVTVDENVNPGRYGFRIEHDNKTHYFSSDEKSAIRGWMKAIMKATIRRDYTKPVIFSCNIPTIPLMVAQAMNPPRARPPPPLALQHKKPSAANIRISSRRAPSSRTPIPDDGASTRSIDTLCSSPSSHAAR